MNRHKVLVVDDDDKVRKIIKVRLNSLGVEVIDGSSGEEGLEKAQKENPAFILCDLSMPKMDGFEFCKRIRTNQFTRDIPIFILTSHHDVEAQAKGRHLGVQGYFKKPFSPKEIAYRILAFLQKEKQVVPALEKSN